MRCPQCDETLEEDLDDYEDGDCFEVECCGTTSRVKYDESVFRGYGVSGTLPVRRLLLVD